MKNAERLLGVFDLGSLVLQRDFGYCRYSCFAVETVNFCMFVLTLESEKGNRPIPLLIHLAGWLLTH